MTLDSALSINVLGFDDVRRATVQFDLSCLHIAYTEAER